MISLYLLPSFSPSTSLVSAGPSNDTYMEIMLPPTGPVPELFYYYSHQHGRESGGKVYVVDDDGKRRKKEGAGTEPLPVPAEAVPEEAVQAEGGGGEGDAAAPKERKARL